MSHEDDKAWESFAKKAESPRIPTPKEAQEIFDAAGTEALTSEVSASIAEQVLAGKLRGRAPRCANDDWLKAEEQRYLRDGVRQLNRNKGDEEAEDDDVLDRLKSEALDDDDDETSAEN